MPAFDVAIVGGGLTGTAAAYYLTRLGAKPVLFEQFDLPNDWSASGDHARIFRYTYGKDTFYTELAVKSLAAWKELQKESREELYTCTGMLEFSGKGGAYEEASYRSLKELGLPVRKMGPSDLRTDFRIFSSRAVRSAIYHPDGGILWSRRAVTAFANAASRRGTLLQKNVKITSVIRNDAGIRELRDSEGGAWKASAYLFAAGPWTRELLAGYRLPLKAAGRQLLYLRPPVNPGRYRPGHCPVFSCLSRGFHGFPMHIHGFMKLGCRRKGPAGKPGPGPQGPTPQFERSCRTFLKDFLPELSGFSETEGKICCYDRTPDGGFIVDQLPGCVNAFVAAGFSDHGYQFVPLIGKSLAEWISGRRPELNLSRFRLNRFR